MRILYVASNSEQSETLQLEKEITELQFRFNQESSSINVELRFLPALSIERLAAEISIFSPTILHITAHGHDDHLSFMNSSGQPLRVTGKTLAALLNVPNPPTLVYLNACSSLVIAGFLAGSIPAVIGTTSEIPNDAARVSAVRFYEVLLRGASIGEAFDNAQALLHAITEDKKDIRLCAKVPETRDLRLADPFQIIARFESEGKSPFRPNRQGLYRIQCGVVGCPQDATVVSFFTDDTTFEDDDKDDLCMGISKGPPYREKIWLEMTEDVYGDFRIGVAGISGSGKAFAAYSLLSDALELYFKRGGYNVDKKGVASKLSKSDKKEFAKAVATLRINDAE